MRFCELREKEVINCCTCTKLGNVVDLEIDECEGCVKAIIVPGPCKGWCILGNDSEYIIPYACIKSIGADIILVEINEKNFLKKCEC